MIDMRQRLPRVGADPAANRHGRTGARRPWPDAVRLDYATGRSCGNMPGADGSRR